MLWMYTQNLIISPKSLELKAGIILTNCYIPKSYSLEDNMQLISGEKHMGSKFMVNIMQVLLLFSCVTICLHKSGISCQKDPICHA